MAKKATRLSKAAKEFNVGLSTIVDFLGKKGIEIDSNPNTKISPEIYDILIDEYSSDISVKKKSEEISQKASEKKETISIDDIGESTITNEEEHEEVIITDNSSSKETTEIQKPKVVGKIDLEPKKKEVEKEEIIVEEKAEEVEEPKEEKIETTEEKVEEKTESEEEKAKEDFKVVGKIDLSSINQKTRPTKKTKEEKEAERAEKKKKKTETTEKEVDQVKEVIEEKNEEVIPDVVETKEEVPEELYKSKIEKLSGPTVVGKIDLPAKKEKTQEDKKSPVASSRDDDQANKKRKRKRIKKKVTPGEDNASDDNRKKRPQKGKKKKAKVEINEEDVQKQIKETLEKLTSKSKSKAAKYRREKRDADKEKVAAELEKQELEKNILKVTEFVSVNELASMMDVAVNEIIATCMNLGLMVSINQRLDAETMSLVAEEFGFEVEFVSADDQEALVAEEEDNEEDLQPRPPIVTVMGHVDHGKTKLLDYIRSANVVAGEAGGITQHIGAYSVELEEGKRITFLDTPGHEAFTAMRARGAQITDVTIVVVAADDGVMPQTVEAINHAAAAGVPIVFAINKIDKPTANPEKIKEALANMNYLVEDWGGKYQSQEISAKQGVNIEELLEKVLLEAEMLDLKANPDKNAVGTVIESSLDKGRGYLTTLLVQGGTLKIGDIILAGCHYGHVKAMYNERGLRIKEAGPSGPVLVLGLNGAPQAGDRFHVMENDSEAKSIATKRQQLIREQGQRTQKHITLDEIGRRIAIGNFQELNVIVKGDVDGSIEALSDALIKLSTEEIEVNIKHKAVGQISESDVILAAASNAIIVGFQVRPSIGARKLAEKEEIDIRLYSIIYDAINEIKDAMGRHAFT
jgi:translation initiation factor IF-2